MYACLECGKKFKTAAAAERAVNNGCPGCGGSDIDLYVPAAGPKPAPKYGPTGLPLDNESIMARLGFAWGYG